jgi:hypothetical protein
MAKKRPEAGRCVYCLRNGERTWDHVFPASWYPSHTPRSLEKWKVPACETCNAKHGRNERDLLIRLALCYQPEDPRIRGVAERARRSVDHRFAKNPKDRAAREQERRRILKETVPFRDAHGTVLPGFGVPEGQNPEQSRAIVAPDGSLETFTGKLVRGITFVADGAFIENEYRIEAYPAVNEEGIADVIPLLAAGTTYHRGPGIFVKRSRATKNDGSGIYGEIWFIRIWERLHLYASVSPRDFT